MENKSIFSFDLEWNYKTISMFIFLIAIPNALGMINISTSQGFKLHLFQIAIFLAALIYGPTGGMISGLGGSLFSAFMMGNPYIAVGNALLGFFAGLFARYGFHTVIAVMLAYLIQLPWLVLTDYYLVHLPYAFIVGLVIALAASNLVWASVAHYAAKPFRNHLS